MHDELYTFHSNTMELKPTPYTNEFAVLAYWPHLEDRFRASATVGRYESKFYHISCALPCWVVFLYIQQSCTHENQCEALAIEVRNLLLRNADILYRKHRDRRTPTRKVPKCASARRWDTPHETLSWYWQLDSVAYNWYHNICWGRSRTADQASVATSQVSWAWRFGMRWSRASYGSV